jgi:nucleotide-binding universal stress UspA family protein
MGSIFESDHPGDAIVDLARHNSVALIVLGAPNAGGRAFAQSVAATVSARARCSVHLVRVPRR